MVQLQTLNKILQDKDSSIITLNNLTCDYFSDYKDEFWFIKQHLDTYGNIPDLETFCSKFPDFEIIQVNEGSGYLLTELMNDKNRRFLAENYMKMRDMIMNNDVEAGLALLQQTAQEMSTAVTLNCVDLLTDTSRFDKYIDKTENLNKYFVKTGFDELDSVIGGWDVNEDLVTITARPGVGKSWILFKCASAAAKQGKRVGIYSGEMSEDSVGYRIDTLIGHVSNGALVHGGGSVKNEYKRFISTLQEQVPGKLFVLTPKMINGSAGVSALRAFVEKYNLDILFVDQHSLLVDDKKAKSQTEKAYNISTDLKLLQTIKRIPVICVCQQNREKLENGFDTTQLAQSDKIGQDSSIVIFIERKDDLLKLHLVKSRNSGTGSILTYKTDLNQGLFTFVPDEKSTQQSVEASGYSEDEVF